MLEIAAFTWVPNDGPLVIDLASFVPTPGSAQTIGSIYFPKLDIPVTCAATPTPENGNPFYIAVPVANNPQTIPVPKGSTTITLTASSASTYYVWASLGIFRPLLEGPIA